MEMVVRELNMSELRVLFDAEHKAHAEEVESSTFQLPYNPAFDVYEALLASGNFIPLAAFVDGECAGYLNIMAQPAMCSKDCMVAVTDSFYVSPKFRRTGVMDTLVAHAEALCSDAGIFSLSLAVMSGKGGGASFVESLGYTKAEITYTKIL